MWKYFTGNSKAEKIVIATFVTLFVASSLFLAYVERSQRTPGPKNAWSAFFQDPADKNLSFIIKNDSSASEFIWTISSEKQKLKQDTVSLTSGESKTVTVDAEGFAGKKIEISVAKGKEKYSLYKNL